LYNISELKITRISIIILYAVFARFPVETGKSSRQNPEVVEIVYKQKNIQILSRYHHVQVQVQFILPRGNPAKLLKGINPLEAQLLETAVDCHVRFRLGGDTFPPNIYYKVFSKTNVCDINAFAPRDYASLPREVGK
jgi:hypothetical protein